MFNHWMPKMRVVLKIDFPSGNYIYLGTATPTVCAFTTTQTGSTAFSGTSGSLFTGTSGTKYYYFVSSASSLSWNMIFINSGTCKIRAAYNTAPQNSGLTDI